MLHVPPFLHGLVEHLSTTEKVKQTSEQYFSDWASLRVGFKTQQW